MQPPPLDAKNDFSTTELVQIPKEKYAKIVEGRNRFFVWSIGAVFSLWLLGSAPQFIIHRVVKRAYRQHCHGKVLDLSPKLYDATDVSFYEMSRAVQVQYMVEKRVVDDGRYRVDESLNAAEQDARRQAMTLDFMIRNDHNWVGSVVNFDLVEREELQRPDFVKFDTAVIRDELLNHKPMEARELLNFCSSSLREDGKCLVMDFGKSKYPMLNQIALAFNRCTNSSMCLTHDYHQWIKEDAVFSIAEEHRCLLGFYYVLVLTKRP